MGEQGRQDMRCDEIPVIASNAYKCTNFDDCKNAYCANHIGILNERGYCDECAIVVCDECCDTEMERGKEIHCSNTVCDEGRKLCQECAGRILNASGQCPACSGEDCFECACCRTENPIKTRGMGEPWTNQFVQNVKSR